MEYECPFGGYVSNDCADCAYACDYHFVNGECVEREPDFKTLYFINSKSEWIPVKEGIGTSTSDEEISDAIEEYIRQKNPEFKIYYTRQWEDKDGNRRYDVGSWTEFFVLGSEPIKNEG